MAVTINEGTQTGIKTDLVGTLNYQVIKLDMGTAGVANPFSGTIPTVSNLAAGTITRLEGGTVTLSNPTGTTVTVDHGTVTLSNPTGTTVQFNNGTIDLIKAGTITTLPNIPGGTLGLITRISTLGTMEVGTISSLPNIPGGTLGLITRVGNVGTLEVGTISSLPNLPQGSINVTAGTITAGTVGGKAATGAAASGNPVFVAGTDPGGTIYGLRTDVNGVLQINGTVATGGAGTQPVRLIDGTLTSGPGAYAEDTGHTSGNTGLFMLAVRNDVGTSLVNTDLDYAPLSLDQDGNLRTTATLVGGGTTVTIDHGTITVSNPTGTTIQFNNGTIDLIKAGTITTLPNIPGGTVGLVTRVGNVGTLELGTVTVTNPTGTTITVDHGTVTLSNPTGTTIQFNNGTVDLVKAGTITRVEGGTIQSNILTGTITSITNLAAGTITRLEQGSINVTAGTLTRVGNIGTIESGTVILNPKPSRNIFNFGTVTNGTIGTLVAAPGAGTSIWINDVSVECYGGTVEAVVSWALSTTGGGAAGGGPVIRGNFTTGGGQQKTPAYPFNGGTTNSALTYNILSGSGTVSYLVSYWVE